MATRRLFIFHWFSPPRFRYSSRSFASYYHPDPVSFQTVSPDRIVTTTAYRVSKDHIHYAHTRIVDSMLAVQVLDVGAFPIIVGRSEEPNEKANQVVEESDASNVVAEIRKKRSKRLTMRDTLENSDAALLRAVEESPSADAYVIEMLPAAAMRTKDRSLQRIMALISARTRIIRAYLTAKYKKQLEENGTKSDSLTSNGPIDPIFESTGRLVEKMFELRKSPLLCERLVPIVRSLPDHYSSGAGTIQVELSDSFMKVLNSWPKDATKDMERHLLCAVTLECVAFSMYLLEKRSMMSKIGWDKSEPIAQH